MEIQEESGKKNKIIGRVVLIAVLLIGIIWGFVKYREAQRFESTDDAQLESDITPLSPRVSGYVDKVYFTDNQLVKKGDTLLKLNDGDYQIKVEMAQAALENAKANLDVAKANAVSTQESGGSSQFKIDEIKIRVANAQKEFDRYQKMLAGNAATEQQFEKVKTEKETLEKQLKVAQQQLKESNSKTTGANEQIKVAESNVKQKQSDLDFAKLQLSYTVVIAPFDGIVSKKNAVLGQLIQGGQAICSIIANENVWVVANFKETQMSKMKEGQEVEVEVDALQGEKVKGHIISFFSATGSKFSLLPPDNASGNYVKVVQRIPVKIVLDKNTASYKKLKPGMSVFVKVLLTL